MPTLTKHLYFLKFRKNYTIAKMDNKTVKVKTFGKEKERISLILCITENGKKLTPLTVFKGKPEATIYKQLQKNINVQISKINVECQEKSWVTEDIFYKWLIKCYLEPTQLNLPLIYYWFLIDNNNTSRPSKDDLIRFVHDIWSIQT